MTTVPANTTLPASTHCAASDRCRQQVVDSPWLLRAALLAAVCFTLLTFVATYRYYGSFIRGADAQMYYTQVRSVVVDRDLHFTNEITQLTPRREIFHDDDGTLRLPMTPDGRVANKYAAGWAIVTLPVFVTTHAICLALGLPADGYSTAYDVTTAAWHGLLALAGLATLALMTGRRLGYGAAAIAVLGIALASNFAYYAGTYPLMTHATSFAMVAWLVCCGWRLYEHPTAARWWIIAATVVWFVVLLRPTDGVLGVVLLPAAWRVWREHGWRHMLPTLLPGVSVVLAGLTQLLVWRLSHGSWVANSYGAQGEGFHWLAPALPSILVAWNHGAWYFHPVLVLGVVGLLVALLHPRERQQRAWWGAMLIAWVLHTYVHAAWHDWPFGHSFGHRIFMNSAPLMLVGTALLIRSVPTRPRQVLIACLALAIGWNSLLMVTFVRGGIPAVGDVPPRQLWEAQRETISTILSRFD